MTDVVAAWLSIGVVILLASAAFGYRMRLNRAAQDERDIDAAALEGDMREGLKDISFGARQ